VGNVREETKNKSHDTTALHGGCSSKPSMLDVAFDTANATVAVAIFRRVRKIAKGDY
jgi:hypothetical protein